MKKFRNSVKTGIICALMIVYLFIVIYESGAVKTAVASSIDRCMNVVIPSLFAFMAVSGFLISSGLYVKLSAPFSVFARLLRIPKQLFSVFLISSIAGYPVGAKALRTLVESGNLSKKAAENMLCFCFGAGPAFFSSIIGLALFGSVRVGMIVFLSCFISNLVLAAVICRFTSFAVPDKETKLKVNSLMLMDSVIQTGRSLAEICVIIVFFSTIMAVLDSMGIITAVAGVISSKNGTAIVSSILELTCATSIPQPELLLLPIIAALCSFGGLCVILQVNVVLKGTISMKRFLLSRPFAALFSAVNSIWLSKLMLPETISTISMQQKVFVKVNNFIPSVCLILMILMLNVKKGVEISK